MHAVAGILQKVWDKAVISVKVFFVFDILKQSGGCSPSPPGISAAFMLIFTPFRFFPSGDAVASASDDATVCITHCDLVICSMFAVIILSTKPSDHKQKLCAYLKILLSDICLVSFSFPIFLVRCRHSPSFIWPFYLVEIGNFVQKSPPENLQNRLRFPFCSPC